MWPFNKAKQAPATESAPAPQPAPVPRASCIPGVNRVEEIVFSFQANYQQAIKYRALIGEIDPSLARATIPVYEGDVIKFTYRIICAYFGDCARKLGYIQQLAEDPELLVKVDIAELQHGRSIMLETMWAIDKAIERIQLQQSMRDDQP